MWNLFMLFWEIRLMYSWILLLLLWHELGFLNVAIKFLVLMDMRRILDLPVTLENLNFKIQFSSPVNFCKTSVEDNITELGSANLDTEEERIISNSCDSTNLYRNRENLGFCSEIVSVFWKLYCAVGSVIIDSSLPTLIATVDLKSIKVKSPPLEMDDRWDSEDIIVVSSVTVKFPFFKSLFLYIFSFTELMFVESVEVGRMRIFIEGHRRFRGVASVGTMTDECGGGDISSSRQERIISVPVGAEEVTDFNFQLIGRTRRIRKKQQMNSVGVGCAMDSNVGVPSTSSALPSLPEPPISSKATQQRPVALLPVSNSPLRRNSLFQLVSKVATSATTAIKELESSKRDMDRYWKERASDLNQLQQKISSTVSDLTAEAVSFNTSVASAGLLQATKQKMSEVYVKTKRKLEESVNDKIGSFHVKMNGPEPEQTPGETRLICGTISVANIDIFMKRALPIQLRHLEQKPLKVTHIRMQDVGLSAVSGTGCCPPSSSYNAMVSSAAAGPTATRRLKEDIAELENAWATQAVRSTSARSVDVYKAGVDVNIIKYRFERLLLVSLYHCNAGRLLYDVFQVDQWGQWSPSAAGRSQSGAATSITTATPVLSTDKEDADCYEDDISEAAEGDPDYRIVSSHPFFFEDT